jgi:hypothetical protein
MTQTVVVHISNEDPVVGELDELPAVTDTMLVIHNPRQRDGKDISYLSNDVVTVIWPVNKISFIEVMPNEAGEQIIGFVRE